MCRIELLVEKLFMCIEFHYNLIKEKLFYLIRIHAL